MSLDYNRQLELFDPATFNKEVHVIGAGATGSWLVLILAKLGISNISVYDYDIVEEHNIPNQLYGTNSIGKSKVQELKKIVFQQTGIRIKTFDKKIQNEEDTRNMKGYVFVLVDSMLFRERIFTYLLNNAQVDMIFETRMGLEHGRIYVVNPKSSKDREKYRQTLYTDEDSAVSACGASQSVSVTAMGISQMAVWEMLKCFKNQLHLFDEDFNKYDVVNEILFDYSSLNILVTTW